MFITEYAKDLRYGGAEEGGWYYDGFTFIKTRPLPKRKGLRVARLLERRAVAENKLRRPYRSVRSDDHVHVEVEKCAGALEFQRRPHYE
jgi:hypothetical protein